MSKMNHNRPQFQKQRFYERNDQYVPPHRRCNSIDGEIGRVEAAVLAYDGTDSELLGLRSMVVAGGALSDSEKGRANWLLRDNRGPRLAA